MFLWLQQACWSFPAGQLVFSYFMKLGIFLQFERFHLQHIQMVNKMISAEGRMMS